MIYLVLGFLGVVTLTASLVFVLRGNRSQAKVDENPYHGLRSAALAINSAKLGLTSPSPGTVIAVLMETSFGTDTTTLFCAADGTASLYFSNGGGIIGSGAHREVAGKAFEFVEAASHFTQHCSATSSFPLPPSDHTQFYLVTSAGVLTALAPESDLEQSNHPLSPLFHLGHEVLTELRTIQNRQTRA